MNEIDKSTKRQEDGERWQNMVKDKIAERKRKRAMTDTQVRKNIKTTTDT